MQGWDANRMEREDREKIQPERKREASVNARSVSSEETDGLVNNRAEQKVALPKIVLIYHIRHIRRAVALIFLTRRKRRRMGIVLQNM